MAVIDNALNTQQTASDAAAAINRDIYGETKGMLSPYVEAGAGMLGDLSGMAGQPQAGQQYMGNLAAMSPQMSSDYGSLLQDPGYQFVNQQAQEAARRMLSSGGMSGSRYGADVLGDVGRQVAVSERDRFDRMNQGNYDRAYGQQADLFNMANQGQGSQYNRMMGVAGMGQNAAVNMANAGAGFAGSQSDLLTGMANARASGMLSNQAFGAQQSADQNALWAGLAGTALGNVGGITDAAGSAWDTVSGWF